MYGPIPDENGLVDLSYYAQNYIPSYTITIIPEENQEYLDSGLKASDMHNMFWSTNKLITLDIPKIDTSNVTNMRDMFSYCNNLTSLDLSNLNTSNVTDVCSMFTMCESLTSLDLFNFDTSKVIDMSYMFASCASLTNLDLSNFDTSKVIDMSFMFFGCDVLTTVIGSLDMSSCESCASMFGNRNNARIHLKNVPRSLNLGVIGGGTEGQNYIIDNYID